MRAVYEIVCKRLALLRVPVKYYHKQIFGVILEVNCRTSIFKNDHCTDIIREIIKNRIILLTDEGYIFTKC